MMVENKLWGKVFFWIKELSQIFSCPCISLGTTKRSRRKVYDNEDGKEVMELPIFDLVAIVNATDNFSNNKKLGEGGFGHVFKVHNNIARRTMFFYFQNYINSFFQGILLEMGDIAVKRLSKNSRQGLNEFKN
jgi:hypothetical protein